MGKLIHLFKEADSSSLQFQREHLLVFLKGSKKKKMELKQKQPELFPYFELISSIQQRHEVHGLPSQYLYLFVCCFQSNCPHPLCQSGKEGILMEWFSKGSSVHKLPLLVLTLSALGARQNAQYTRNWTEARGFAEQKKAHYTHKHITHIIHNRICLLHYSLKC